MMTLDDIDHALLRALGRDATQSAGALGRELGLSQPATWRRIRRLQDAGIIRGRKLDLDAGKLGFGVTVFLGIKLATKGRVSLEAPSVLRTQPSFRLAASHHCQKRNPPNPWGSGGFQILCTTIGCLRFVFWCCNRAFVVVIRGCAADIVEQFCNLEFCRCFFFSCQFLN